MPKATPRHIIFTIRKSKKNLEKSEGKKITFPIEEQRQKLKSDLSSEVIQASGEWSEIFKVPREQTCT